MEITKGLTYICSIIEAVKELKNVAYSKNNYSFVVPQYIFRGITKHYVTYNGRKKDINNKTSDEELNVYVEQCDRQNSCDINDKFHNIESAYNKKCQEIIKEAKEIVNKSKETEHNSRPELSLLYNIINHNNYSQICPDYIQSGAAIRLNAMGNKDHNDYFTYINRLLSDFKELHPQDCHNSDIEILADLQHYGAATCLVDFSNNLLISLWFATQLGTDINEMGFLFCYDINTEILVDGKLSILNEQNYKNKTISDILKQTTKVTKYNGMNEYKFWLWKPSKLNTRITRQDSVFLFGIEPFKIIDHNISIIPIPPDWKEPIQKALKAYFGITSESVYCDKDGFTMSNAKNKSYNFVDTSYFQFKRSGDDIKNLQIGTSCLLKAEYSQALNYFESIDIKNDNDIDDTLIKIETLYSKALCNKGLLNLYIAISQLEDLWKIIVAFEDSIKNEKKEEIIEKKITIDCHYIELKKYKIIGDLIPLLYDTYQFQKALDFVHSIKKRDTTQKESEATNTANGNKNKLNIEQTNTADDNNLNIKQKTVSDNATLLLMLKIELTLLLYIVKLNANRDCIQEKNTLNKYFKKIFNSLTMELGREKDEEGSTDNDNNLFSRILAIYFGYVFYTIYHEKNPNDKNIQDVLIFYQKLRENAKDRMRRYIDDTTNIKDMIKKNRLVRWNFCDIKQLIEKYYKENTPIYNELMTYTSEIEEIRDLLDLKLSIDFYGNTNDEK